MIFRRTILITILITYLTVDIHSVLNGKDIASSPNLNYRFPRFEHLGSESGLNQSRISSIIQDRRGFIWLGTMDGGLVRFDGYTFKTFIHNPNDSNSLSNNQIRTIFEDTKERLWIGTSNALNCYNMISETFSHISLESDSSDTVSFQISSICEDSTGNIWLGTAHGLFRLSFLKQKDNLNSLHSGFHIDHFLPEPDDIQNTANNILSLLVDRNGILLSAGTAARIYKV